MKQNELKLNEEKTEFIVFGTRREVKNLKINSFLLAGFYYLEIKHSKKSGRDYGPIL